MKKELTSVYGNKFTFRVEEMEDISVLSGGYTITPEGEFVNVLDSEEHNDVFSQYLRAYLEEPNRLDEDTIHALISLTMNNHIAYCGIKMGDNYREGNFDKGYALMVFPSDMSVLTSEQRESCLALFNTNRSIFGNRKKVELQIRDFDGGEFTQEELTERFTEELDKLKGKRMK